jgi:hypothetical protein
MAVVSDAGVDDFEEDSVDWVKNDMNHVAGALKFF